MMAYQPLTVLTDPETGHSLITMPSRMGQLQVFIDKDQMSTDPIKTMNMIIDRLNDGIEFLQGEMMLRQKGPSHRVN